jgi:hypothetical protein
MEELRKNVLVSCESNGDDFDVTKYGDDALEQISNMQFTTGEQKILEFAFHLDEDEFSDEDYYELAYYFAKHNGLNT